MNWLTGTPLPQLQGSSTMDLLRCPEFYAMNMVTERGYIGYRRKLGEPNTKPEWMRLFLIENNGTIRSRDMPAALLKDMS